MTHTLFLEQIPIPFFHSKHYKCYIKERNTPTSGLLESTKVSKVSGRVYFDTQPSIDSQRCAVMVHHLVYFVSIHIKSPCLRYFISVALRGLNLFTTDGTHSIFFNSTVVVCSFCMNLGSTYCMVHNPAQVQHLLEFRVPGVLT